MEVGMKRLLVVGCWLLICMTVFGQRTTQPGVRISGTHTPGNVVVFGDAGRTLVDSGVGPTNIVLATNYTAMVLNSVQKGSVEWRAATNGNYWTLVVLPDQQELSDSTKDAARGGSGAETISNIVTWIESQLEAENIQGIVNLGDTINNNFDTMEEISNMWARASYWTNMYGFGVPVVWALGNHDYNDSGGTNKTTLANQYIPSSLYENQPWFGGAQTNGLIANCYYEFTAGNREYLFIVVDVVPSDASIEWARDLVEANQDKEVMIVNHYYLSPYALFAHGRGIDGNRLFDTAIAPFNNVSAVLCGHIGHPIPATNLAYGASWYQTSYTKGGAAVNEIVKDYQSTVSDSFIGMFRFYSSGDIMVRTYKINAGEYSTHPADTFFVKRDTSPSPINSEASYVSRDGLQGYWDLSYTTGVGTVPDWSGNGNVGILSGGAFLTNGAVRLDGKPDRVLLDTTTNDQSYTNGITMFVEVTPINASNELNSENELMGTRYSYGANEPTWYSGWSLYMTSTKVPAFLINTDGDGGTLYENKVSGVADNYKLYYKVKSRVVVTHNAETDALKIWMDGQRILSETLSYTPISYDPLAGLQLGSYPNSNGGTKVDFHKAAIWNKPLSDQEARKLSDGALVSGLSLGRGITERVGVTANLGFNVVDGQIVEKIGAPISIVATNGTTNPINTLTDNDDGSWYVMTTNQAAASGIAFTLPGGGAVFDDSSSKKYKIRWRFDGNLSENFVRISQASGITGNSGRGSTTFTIRREDTGWNEFEFTASNAADDFIQFQTTGATGWFDGTLWVEAEEL